MEQVERARDDQIEGPSCKMIPKKKKETKTAAVCRAQVQELDGVCSLYVAVTTEDMAVGREGRQCVQRNSAPHFPLKQTRQFWNVSSDKCNNAF